MLTHESAAVVRTTLPVIGGAIGEITPVFYRRMFTAHPELERDLFNRGNQARGDQQRALAGAIVAYATQLVGDGPDPRTVLARIAHKHASLGILPEQYSIVHEHLFAAIVEVLGDAVTPQVAAAWDEVYWDMADALVSIEQGLYDESGVAPGDVWRTVTINRRAQESPDTVSLELVAPDGGSLPAARAGQYISVAVVLPDGARQIRQYSLTGAAAPGAWTISVKAILEGADRDGVAPAGEVSNHLHANAFEGDTLDVSIPFGELTLVEGENPLVLVSAGIGITPMIGFLHHLRRTGTARRVVVLHADRSPARHAHRAELRALVDDIPTAELHRWYEDLGARPTRDRMRSGFMDLDGVDLPHDADAYLCGPAPFMTAVQSALLGRGITADRIHHEVFGARQEIAVA